MKKLWEGLTFKAVLALAVVTLAVVDSRSMAAQQACSSTGGDCISSCFDAAAYCANFGQRCGVAACENNLSCGLFQVQVTCGAINPGG